MSLNQIVKVRYADGREVALVDWTDTPLYSTIEVLDGATAEDMVFFQYTVGDPVPGFGPVPPTLRNASDRDTNLAVPGAMASTEEFLIWSIRPEVFRLRVVSALAPDLAQPAAISNDSPEPTPTGKMLEVIALFCLLELEISQKFYSKASFGYYNWGAGAFISQSCGTQVSTGMKGLPSQEAVRRFSVPAHMGGQEKFKLSLKNPSGAVLPIGAAEGGCEGDNEPDPTRFARIIAHFDGLYKRPTS